MTTSVTVYQEIGNLAWAQNAELNMETTLQSQRSDPVATHAGENVLFVHHRPGLCRAVFQQSG
jgi:hypothetical protein